MNKLFTLLLAVLVASKTLGQTEILKQAGDLIAEHQYRTSFKLLDSADSRNKKPDFVLLKEYIALNYFVASIMHQMFAFKNLNKGEDILNYRGKEGSCNMFQFPINTILDSLIITYPEDYRLYKGLGDFYYEVQQKYRGNWMLDDSTLSILIEKNYQIAIDHHVADYLVYYSMGIEFLLQNNYKKAINYFSKSIELNVNFADANYNIAYAYLYTDDMQDALKYAMKSCEMYKDSNYKSDAARMIGEIYRELKDDENAIASYEMANRYERDNYHNMKPLLHLYVKTDNTRRKDLLNSFYNLAPDKSIIYNDLEDIYLDNEKSNELIEFYKSELVAYQNDNKVSGNLYFYLGRIYLNKDKKVAKEYFLRAKKNFADIYEKDNEIFKEIDKIVKEAEN